jgi:hypothetical protein
MTRTTGDARSSEARPLDRDARLRGLEQAEDLLAQPMPFG